MESPFYRRKGDVILPPGERVNLKDRASSPREGLAKMKRAAGRPQDEADLSQLGLDEGGETGSH